MNKNIFLLKQIINTLYFILLYSAGNKLQSWPMHKEGASVK